MNFGKVGALYEAVFDLSPEKLKDDFMKERGRESVLVSGIATVLVSMYELSTRVAREWIQRPREWALERDRGVLPHALIIQVSVLNFRPGLGAGTI